MIKIDHIGIAVKNLDEAIKTYNLILKTKPYKEEIITSEQVKTVFYKSGESKIELLEGLDSESVISKFIEKKGSGVHHIAFDVDDIYAEISRLELEGYQLISKTPRIGADSKLIAFLHPKSTNGVLIELCQTIKS